MVGEQRLTVRNGHHHCWVFGVQWHREDSDGPAHSRQALFAALLAEATRYQSACRTG